jgi:hypothetical protein
MLLDYLNWKVVKGGKRHIDVECPKCWSSLTPSSASGLIGLESSIHCGGKGVSRVHGDRGPPPLIVGGGRSC